MNHKPGRNNCLVFLSFHSFSDAFYIFVSYIHGDVTGEESKTADKDVLLIQSVSKLCLNSLIFYLFCLHWSTVKNREIK